MPQDKTVVHLIDVDAEDVELALEGIDDNEPKPTAEEIEKFLKYLEGASWHVLDAMREDINETIKTYWDGYKLAKANNLNPEKLFN